MSTREKRVLWRVMYQINGKGNTFTDYVVATTLSLASLVYKASAPLDRIPLKIEKHSWPESDIFTEESS